MIKAIWSETIKDNIRIRSLEMKCEMELMRRQAEHHPEQYDPGAYEQRDNQTYFYKWVDEW